MPPAAWRARGRPGVSADTAARHHARARGAPRGRRRCS